MHTALCRSKTRPVWLMASWSLRPDKCALGLGKGGSCTVLQTLETARCPLEKLKEMVSNLHLGTENWTRHLEWSYQHLEWETLCPFAVAPGQRRKCKGGTSVSLRLLCLTSTQSAITTYWTVIGWHWLKLLQPNASKKQTYTQYKWDTSFLLNPDCCALNKLGITILCSLQYQKSRLWIVYIYIYAKI